MPKVSQLSAAAVKKRVKKIMQRKKLRRRPVSETLNTSHARELVARKIILPEVRQEFGKDLKALLIVGSVQLGVRKATTKKEASDLDIAIVVDNLARHLGSGRTKRVFNRLWHVCSRAGVPLNLFYRDSAQLRSERSDIRVPIQVVYGRAFVESKLGTDYETLQREKKRHARNEARYSGR